MVKQFRGYRTKGCKEFIFIFGEIRVKLSLKCQPSSRELYWYRRGHGFATALVANVTVMISHLFIVSSAVQIYEFSYIHSLERTADISD